MNSLILKKNSINEKKDKLFNQLLWVSGCLVILILIGFFITLIINSYPSISKFGLPFIFSDTWDPNEFNGKDSATFGALPFIIGTLLTSVIAILISLPFSIATALLLGERLKKGLLKKSLESIIDVLAGIPSVIYGFWGLLVLVPIIINLEIAIGVIPYGVGILSASLILAIMIIPYSVALSKEVILLIPPDLKEASYALGATQYEVTKYTIIPNAKSGIIAGQFLAFGRAISETMAVTMVIGNRNEIPLSIFDPANTLASVIANEFAEATGTLYISSLIELGLILLCISIIINVIGRLILKKLT